MRNAGAVRSLCGHSKISSQSGASAFRLTLREKTVKHADAVFLISRNPLSQLEGYQRKPAMKPFRAFPLKVSTRIESRSAHAPIRRPLCQQSTGKGNFISRPVRSRAGCVMRAGRCVFSIRAVSWLAPICAPLSLIRSKANSLICHDTGRDCQTPVRAMTANDSSGRRNDDATKLGLSSVCVAKRR